MANPWDNDPIVGQPAAQPRQQFPGVIQGMPKTPDPIAQERIDLARDANERANRAEDRANAAERRQAEAAARGSVEQGKAASFLKRGINAETNFRSLGDVQPRSLPGQAFKDSFPNAANYVSDSERQRADQAEREFIAAILRYDSGAAIPPEEFVTNGQIYFPRPGDSPETLAQKAQARRTALEGLFAAAGPAASGMELPNFDDDGLRVSVTSDRPWTIEDTIATWGEAYYDENGNPLGPDGGGAYDKDGNYVGLTGRVTDEGPNDYQRQISERADEFEQRFGEAGAIDLAKSGITFGLTDESSGVGNVLGRALMGDFDIAENYREGRDMQREIERRARERTGLLGTAAELVGAGGAVRSAGSAALNAARGLRAGGQAVNRAAIQGRMVRNATVEGAGVGALGGFGYGEGVEGSTTNALLGGALGGVIGNVGQRVGNALANRGPSGTPPSGGQVMQAADDLGIEPTPAVVGGRTTQILTGGARQGFISDRPISRAVERMEGQGQAARDRIASNAGQVLDAEDAGDVVRQAANVYSQRTSQIGGSLYTRADRRAGGIKLPLPKAVQAADDEMAQLAKGPGGTDSAIYKDLAKLKKQMEGGSFEVDGIRAFRSRIRTEMTERGLRGTPQDVALGRILQAAEDDMIAGLQAAGKTDAASALKTAASFWRKRVETIDQVLEPVIGKNAPKSGEQIVSALENMANPKSGNAARLRGLFKAMPKDEARAVSATIINRMGQPTKGSANMAEDSGFSFNTFLTNYNNMSPRAKAAIFDGETRDALAKLAMVSRGVKEAGGAANTSNTAGAAVVQTFLSGGLWYLEPMTAVVGGAGQYAVGKLLASPKFARLIAGAPKAGTPQARKALSARLANLAKAEPTLANEIGIYRSALDSAANDNAVVMQSAAKDENAEERR